MDREAVKFSVLGAFYSGDDPELLHKALRSVYTSSIVPSQFCLVQDGPVPNRLRCVVEEFIAIPGFEHIELASNSGLAAALNFGISKIHNEFIVRIDADDVNLPNRFEALIAQLEDGFDLVGSWIQEYDAEGQAIAIRQVPLCEEEIKKGIGSRNPFNHMSVAFRRSSVINAGLYPNIFLREDYGLWALMIANGSKTKNLPVVLVNVSAGKNMYERRGGWRYAAAEIHLQRHLLACGLQSLPKALIIGCLRAFIFLLPSRLRGLFYVQALRSPY